MKFLRPVTAALLLLSMPVLYVYCGEPILIFKGAKYPLKAHALPRSPGAPAVYETPMSEIPAEAYDTVIMQGMMPDPSVTIQVVTGEGASARELEKPVIKRFPNGRFWLKFRTDASTREPVRIKVTQKTPSGASFLSVYEAEAFSEAAEAEEGAGEPREYAAVPYSDKSLPFPLVARTTWKAKPPKASYTADSPVRFTLHHTAGEFPASYSAAVAEIQFIQDYHQSAKKWIDIGYHFLISPQGDIFEGRPATVVGAHVLNHNSGNTGVSFMGNYTEETPTKAALEAFLKVGRHLRTANNAGSKDFKAHRDWAATECPGDKLYARVGDLRTQIFDKEPALSVYSPVFQAPAAVPPGLKAYSELAEAVSAGK